MLCRHCIVVVQVLASYGHVRDLLNKAGAVDPDNDFKLVWAISGAAGGCLQQYSWDGCGCPWNSSRSSRTEKLGASSCK